MIKEIRTRRSIRKFNKKNVENDKLIGLIEASRLAPSGKNTQPWRFIIVKNQETKEKIACANNNQKWLSTADVHIVCVADTRSRIKDDTEISVNEQSDLFELKQVIRDTSIATGYLLLEAEALGLSTCWVAWFEQKEIRDILEIPSDKFVIGVVAVGYSEVVQRPTPRINLAELLRYEKW